MGYCGMGCKSMRTQSKVKSFFEELDALFAANRIREAGECIERWMKNTEAPSEWNLHLTVLNEQLGYLRSTGQKAKGIAAVIECIRVIGEHGLQNDPGTEKMYINIATTLCRFQRAEEGLSFYRKAEELMERECAGDYLFATLYNNEASAYLQMGRPDHALTLYEKALARLRRLPGTYPTQAVTYANESDLYLELRQVHERHLALQKMQECLDHSDNEYNSDYASACRKCASAYGRAGLMQEENELIRRAERIYAGNTTGESVL